MPQRTRNPLCRPFLKWAGGKRQLLPELSARIPTRYGTYFEPFLGGGALFLSLQRPHAVVNDSNKELVNCYGVVRDNVEDLILELRQHQERNSEDYFYEVRDWDRASDYGERHPVVRAARIIYLNKTCYNGLFRVNAQGQFNVPYGKYLRPSVVEEGVLRAVSHYLNEADVTFLSGDFADAALGAKRDDFLYFDPPYDPVSDTASFTGYDVNGFDRSEQERLRQLVATLHARGCRVMVSNAATNYIRSLYRGFTCDTIEASRAINSVAHKRGKVDEIVVMNYERPRRRRPDGTGRRAGRGRGAKADQDSDGVGAPVRATPDSGAGGDLWTL